MLTSLHSSTECEPAVVVVSPRMGANGWPFGNVDPFPKAEEDTVNHANHMKDLYLSVNPDYTGRYVCDHLSRDTAAEQR